MLCDYGCGNEAKYILKNGKNCCCKHYASCPEVRRKNSSTLLKVNKNRDYKKQYNDLSQDIKNKMAWSRGKTLKPISEYLRNDSLCRTSYIKKIILKNNLLEYKCEQCGITQWNDKPLSLELHHKDGNNTNNDLSNLCFLCPNCHSQTENYCGKNNSGKIKISDEEILEAYNKTKNIRQTLLYVGLTPMGGNYSRVKRIIKTYQSIIKK